MKPHFFHPEASDDGAPEHQGASGEAVDQEAYKRADNARLELPQGALFASRDVLARFGNMSSSTLMFVLAELIGSPDVRRGVALAFGPGLAAEGFHYERAG